MRKIAATLIALLLVIASCGEDVEDVRLGELAAAEQRWREADLSDYTIIVEHGCLCPPEVVGPFEVRVEGGEILTVEHTDASIDEPRANRGLLTVEAIFEYLRSHVGADGFSVRYDTLGYPRTVNVNPEEGTIDDEFFIGAKLVTE